MQAKVIFLVQCKILFSILKNHFKFPNFLGLFAIRNFQKGDLLALFNGVRSVTHRVGSDDDGTDYKIRLNGQTDLDIPEDCQDLTNYCATLGHKVL